MEYMLDWYQFVRRPAVAYNRAAWERRLCLGLTATNDKELVALLELEVRSVERAVIQLHHKLAAGVCPRLFSLPDVGVSIGAEVVRKTT